MSADDVFVDMVRNYVQENPHIMPRLIDATTRGIQARLDKEQNARVLIESALVTALARRSRSADKTLASMLEKITPIASFDYKVVISELSKPR